jgi:TetR/AcrR family transcriptional repressor of nem operon
MARAREFELDAATDAAVQLFWQRGYGATSVRDLCKAMGVKPGSFYAAFGSKQACFRAALDRYLVAQGVPREAGPEAVRAWLRAIVVPARRGKGCLLINTAVEGPTLEPEIRTLVGERLAAMERFFTQCLGNAEAAGVIASTVIAVHVMARSGASAPRLRALADAALQAVGLAGLGVR